MQGDGRKIWKDIKFRKGLSYCHNYRLKDNGNLNFLKSHRHPLPMTPFTYKMNVKLEEDLQSLLSTMSCWRIDEGSCSPSSVNIQIFLLLEDEIIFKMLITI